MKSVPELYVINTLFVGQYVIFVLITSNELTWLVMQIERLN